jgi:hypothetical protein
MPIFRSRHQAELLVWTLLHPDREYTLTELANQLDIPLTTLHREIERLVARNDCATSQVSSAEPPWGC